MLVRSDGVAPLTTHSSLSMENTMSKQAVGGWTTSWSRNENSSRTSLALPAPITDTKGFRRRQSWKGEGMRERKKKHTGMNTSSSLSLSSSVDEVSMSRLKESGSGVVSVGCVSAEEKV